MYYIEMAIVHDLVNFFFRKVNLVLTKISLCIQCGWYSLECEMSMVALA